MNNRILVFAQVNLYTLLNKFNAINEKEYKTYKENFMKRFEITELPPYLILYIKVSFLRMCDSVSVIGMDRRLHIMLYFIDFRDLPKIHFLSRRIQQSSIFLLSECISLSFSLV